MLHITALIFNGLCRSICLSALTWRALARRKAMEQYVVWWRVWSNHQYPTLLRVRAVLCVALALALAAPYASYAQQVPEPGEGPWTGFDHVLLQHSQELLQ